MKAGFHIAAPTTLAVESSAKSRLLAWCSSLLLLAFLLPNHYSPWLTFHQELVAAIAFAPLITWAVLRNGLMPSVAMGALLVAIAPIAQVLFGLVFLSGDAWVALLYLSGIGLVVLAGASWASHDASIQRSLDGLNVLWIGIVLAAYVSIGIALHQWLDLGRLGIYGADLPPGGRPFGNIAQPNQLATLLLMALAAHVALFESARLRGTVAIAGVLFLVFGLVLSGSRSVLLAMTWLLPSYWLMRHRCGLRTRPLAVAGLSLAFVGAMALWPMLNQLLLIASDASTAVDRMDAPGVRTVYWLSMLDAIGRAPWFGYGWGQIGVAQTETALDYPATHSFFDSSHNILLDLLLWNGLPVGLAVIIGLGEWTIWQIRQCRDPLSWAALIAIGFVASHAMVEYPLSYAYFLLPVGFIMGVLSATHPSVVDKRLTLFAPRVRRLAVRAVGLLALALLLAVGWEYPLWEQDWRDLNYQEARIGDPIRAELPPSILLTQLSEFMKFSRTEAKSGMTPEQLEWMRQVSGRFGYPSAMYRYAMALALNQHPTEAELALRRLCKMQTQRRCISAQRNWRELGQTTHPLLLQVPFASWVNAPD